MDTEICRDVGKHLRALRKAQGRTLHEVAAAAGMYPQMLSRYERGEADAPSSKLVQLARALLVHPGQCFPPTY